MLITRYLLSFFFFFFFFFLSLCISFLELENNINNYTSVLIGFKVFVALSAKIEQQPVSPLSEHQANEGVKIMIVICLLFFFFFSLSSFLATTPAGVFL